VVRLGWGLPPPHNKQTGRRRPADIVAISTVLLYTIFGNEPPSLHFSFQAA